jgi:hypothetical protein
MSLPTSRISSASRDLHMVRIWNMTHKNAHNSPKMTLQQFKTQIILSLGALYDLIFNSSAQS